ncbi:MAG: heme oxygenase (biliverdin-producing) [Clostridium sp.]
MENNNFLNNIRLSSKKLHSMAENTGFISRLISGGASEESYGEYVYNLYFMYKKIEEVLENNKENEVVKGFALPEVYRSESLLVDSKYLLGDKFESVEKLNSTVSFENRLDEIAERNPELIVAHAYTRFLADLFGGRTTYNILKKEYNISDEGLNYYVYEGISNLREFVMEYHNKINHMNLSDDLKDKFINEVGMAYIYNIMLSNEVEFELYNNKK